MNLFKRTLSPLTLTAALLLSSHAHALEPETTPLATQTTITIPYSYKIDNQTVYIGRDACKSLVKEGSAVKITFQTQLDTLLIPKLFESVVKFEVARNSTAKIDCTATTPPSICSEIPATDINHQAREITVNLPFKKLTGYTSESDCDSVNTEWFVRGQFRRLPADTTFGLADARFIIDSVGPPAPVLDSATATDASITVALQVSKEKDIANYALFYSEKPLNAGDLPDPKTTTHLPFGTAETTRSTIKVSLDTQKKYYMALSARDTTGNFGPLSNVVEVTPVKTIDFWQGYLEAGGQDEGCSTLQPPLSSTPFQLLLFGAFALFFQRRRNSKQNKQLDTLN